MADSGTYDQATIVRRQKLAEQMLAEDSKPKLVRNWTEGLANVANTGVDAFNLNRLDRQAAGARKEDLAALMAGLGVQGGQPGVAPAAPSAGPAPSPAAPLSAPSPAVLGAGGSPATPDGQGVYGADAVMMPPGEPQTAAAPRGIRNNNPLNIEAGSFTSGQPGFAGSDGRFAKFEQPQQGVDAAGKLLDTYQNKYGLNTVRGIINRWAPSSEAANNTGGYVASVAGRLGIDPDQPLTPEQRPALIAAMGQFENGRPISGQGAIAKAMTPMAFNGTPQDTPPPATSPTGTPAVAQAMSPQGPSPVGAAGPPPPGGAPVPGAGPSSIGIPDSQKAVIARLLSATPGSAAQQLGMTMLANASKPHDFGFQTLPDGTILRTDPRAGTVQPIYQAPVKPQFTQTGEGAFGDKQFGFVNPATQTVTPANQGQGGATGVPGGDSGFMAKGVTAIDHTLKGQDYLDQFSPEVQSAVRNYVDGKSTPTGNPRKGFTQAVKMISQKYGEDIGQPADDTSFGARRTMRSQLSSGGAGTLGGQINFGNTAIGHLADLSQRALELDNSNGFGIPMVAGAINTIRGATSTDQAGKMQALQDAAQHYGQEITKFYAGSPGGEAERNRFMTAVSAAKSPKELAAVIQQEAELIPSRLSSITGQIQTTLGPQGVKDYPVVRPESEKALETIRGNVDRLRGSGKSAAPNAAPAVTEGATATNPQTKEKMIFRGGKWVPAT